MPCKVLFDTLSLPSEHELLRMFAAKGIDFPSSQSICKLLAAHDTNLPIGLGSCLGSACCFRS